MSHNANLLTRYWLCSDKMFHRFAYEQIANIAMICMICECVVVNLVIKYDPLALGS